MGPGDRVPDTSDLDNPDDGQDLAAPPPARALSSGTEWNGRRGRAHDMGRPARRPGSLVAPQALLHISSTPRTNTGRLRGQGTPPH
eukprot:1257714-Alexandrium_andersonii.AAC.1